MKKLLCICLCLLVLAGCAKKQDVEQKPLIVSGFNAVVNSCVNGITLTFSVSFDTANGYEFTFASPKTLQNIKVTGADGEFLLTGEKLSFNLQAEKMPVAMPCRAVYDCVNAVSGAYPVKAQDGTKEYAYNVNGTDCVLYTDGQNNFLRLTVGTHEFTFDSFSYNN